MELQFQNHRKNYEIYSPFFTTIAEFPWCTHIRWSICFWGDLRWRLDPPTYSLDCYIFLAFSVDTHIWYSLSHFVIWSYGHFGSPRKWPIKEPRWVSTDKVTKMWPSSEEGIKFWLIWDKREPNMILIQFCSISLYTSFTFCHSRWGIQTSFESQKKHIHHPVWVTHGNSAIAVKIDKKTKITAT